MKKITLLDSWTDVLDFGKYKGQSIQHIRNIDISYLSWMIKNVEGYMFTPEIKKIIDKEMYEYTFRRNKVPTYSTTNRKSKRKYSSYSHYDPQEDADFASAFDWGSQ